jgi:hypothetical protein
MSTGSSGVEGRACRRAAAAAKAAAKQQQADDTATGKDQSDSKKAAAAAAAVEGVWFPGAREAAGDDSWYLPSPPTCRLFVGNIGCWVDESMLLAYFGKYGHVVDVQVSDLMGVFEVTSSGIFVLCRVCSSSVGKVWASP